MALNALVGSFFTIRKNVGLKGLNSAITENMQSHARRKYATCHSMLLRQLIFYLSQQVYQVY